MTASQLAINNLQSIRVKQLVIGNWQLKFLIVLFAICYLLFASLTHAQLATIEANATIYLPVIAGANTTQSTLSVKKSRTIFHVNSPSS